MEVFKKVIPENFDGAFRYSGKDNSNRAQVVQPVFLISLTKKLNYGLINCLVSRVQSLAKKKHFSFFIQQK